MRKILRGLVEDIRAGRHIDAYVTLLICAGLAIVSLVDQLPQHILGAALLGSIAWLTANALWVRKEGSSKLRASDFFSEGYTQNSADFNSAFDSARELFIVGMGQRRMLAQHNTKIRRILAEGGTIKVVLVHPDSAALEMAVARSSTPLEVDRTRQAHWLALSSLCSYAREPSNRGEVLVKLISLVPAYTLYAFDLSNPKKTRIFVWLTPFKEASSERPGFQVSFADDPEWAAFFGNQCKKLWEWDEAKPYDLLTPGQLPTPPAEAHPQGVAD